MSDPHQRWISVTGSGEASTAPDLALVRLAVTATGKELAPTRDDVNARSSAVLARLRDLGVTEEDLNAPGVQIRPDYDYRRGQTLTGYRVSREITARVRDLEWLGDLLDGAVAAGANEIHGADMTVSDPSAAEHAALASAVEAARAKAEAIAEAAGVPLGTLIRVEEGTGGMDLPPPGMRIMEMAASADVPTEIAAGDLTIRRHVRAWFSIAE